MLMAIRDPTVVSSKMTNRRTIPSILDKSFKMIKFMRIITILKQIMEDKLLTMSLNKKYK